MKKRTMIQLLLAAVLSYQCAVLADSRLNNLVSERLAVMKDVAAYKWQHELPVEDLAREQIVIDNAILHGLSRGLTTDSSERFFRAQIEAAKAIQSCWHERWRQVEPILEPVDLVGELRPLLLELGEEILDQLNPVSGDRATGYLDIACLPPAAAESLQQSLQAIRFYPNRLMQITHSGILRVGTTGDYAPFSDLGPEDEYLGIDISLAEDLAESLDARLLLVKTSWPTLIRDLEDGHYDIAMSGVSRTVKRAKYGYFSSPYHIGGKTPITRCSRAGEFNSLEKIDQPGVRLIVNPGGTNERFLDTHIRQATKVLHQDNRTIFDALADGKADLMITDAIEVALQTTRRPELCAAMPGKTLTYQEKGFLMPQDSELLHAVNLWLSQRSGDGTIDRVFSQATRN